MATNPVLLTRPFADEDPDILHYIPYESTDETIVTQKLGWQSVYSTPQEAGGLAPERVDMNNVLNVITQLLFYAQKGWIWNYDADQDYMTPALVWDNGFWFCKQDVASGNPYHKPTNDVLHQFWQEMFKLDPSGTIKVDTTPIGTVQAWAGDTTQTKSLNGYYTDRTYEGVPDGWMVCDGGVLNKASYQDLFNVIGYKYGGSGNNFNLPNLSDRFIEGTTGNLGTYISAGLPNITGQTEYYQIDRYFDGSNVSSGCFVKGAQRSGRTDGSNGTDTCRRIKFNAQNSNTIYGASATVQPNALLMKYLIKYK